MEHYVLYHNELWAYNRTWTLAASKLFDKIWMPVALPYCITNSWRVEKIYCQQEIKLLYLQSFTIWKMNWKNIFSFVSLKTLLQECECVRFPFLNRYRKIAFNLHMSAWAQSNLLLCPLASVWLFDSPQLWKYTKRRRKGQVTLSYNNKFCIERRSQQQNVGFGQGETIVRFLILTESWCGFLLLSWKFCNLNHMGTGICNTLAGFVIRMGWDLLQPTWLSAHPSETSAGRGGWLPVRSPYTHRIIESYSSSGLPNIAGLKGSNQKKCHIREVYDTQKTYLRFTAAPFPITVYRKHAFWALPFNAV